MSPLVSRWLSRDIQSRLGNNDFQRLIVAYSGGADSLSLLHLAGTQVKNKPVMALHINHGLHADAGVWQSLCIKTCGDLEVPIKCISVAVKAAGSIEENARQARYAAFENFLEAGDLLLLAHHADDQLETVLFNLFRGNGAVGVLGMPRERPVGKARLFRPLLDVPRAELITYCEALGCAWVEDESNLNTSLDRGYLRHKLVPVIEQRWPQVAGTILSAVDRDNEARQLLEDIAAGDLDSATGSNGGVSVRKLLALSRFRRELLFRAWLEQSGFPMPSTRMLQAVHDDLLEADADAEPVISWQGCEFRRFKGDVFIRREDDAGLDREIDNLDLSSQLNTPIGEMRVERLTGMGLTKPAAGLDIRFRKGGEKMQIRGKTRAVKKIMQESGVPPWLRNRIPLVFASGCLVAIPGIKSWQVEPVISSAYRAAPDETGLLFWFSEKRTPI